MSKYNQAAKDLDAAFKAARSEYAAAYNAVEEAKKAAQTPGADALKMQKAALKLQEAENNLHKESARIWTDFDEKAASLRRGLEKEVQAGALADPSAIDSNAVELMKTPGLLSADDYYNFADKFGDNVTMLRLIGHYAELEAENATDAKDRAALNVLAAEYSKGTGKTLRTWDSLMSIANYCSGRGHSGNRRITPAVTLSMGDWWEQLSGEIVEDF